MKAFATLVTADEYVDGALTLAHSLRRNGTIHDIAVLVPPSMLSSGSLQRLYRGFDRILYVPLWTNQRNKENLALLGRPELDITYTKLHVFSPDTMDGYEMVAFLDADAFVLRNVDDLFEYLGDAGAFAAAPDVGWPDSFNSGVFVLRPNQAVMDSLIWEAEYGDGSFDGGDQGLLNRFFDSWSGFRRGARELRPTSGSAPPRPDCPESSRIAYRIPFSFNVTPSAVYSYLPAVKEFESNTAVIHFAGFEKPWKQPRFTDGTVWNRSLPTEILKLHNHWWSVYDEMTNQWTLEDLSHSEASKVFRPKSSTNADATNLETVPITEPSGVQTHNHANNHKKGSSIDYKDELSLDVNTSQAFRKEEGSDSENCSTPRASAAQRAEDRHVEQESVWPPVLHATSSQNGTVFYGHHSHEAWRDHCDGGDSGGRSSAGNVFGDLFGREWHPSSPIPYYTTANPIHVSHPYDGAYRNDKHQHQHQHQHQSQYQYQQQHQGHQHQHESQQHEQQHDQHQHYQENHAYHRSWDEFSRDGQHGQFGQRQYEQEHHHDNHQQHQPHHNDNDEWRQQHHHTWKAAKQYGHREHGQYQDSFHFPPKLSTDTVVRGLFADPLTGGSDRFGGSPRPHHESPTGWATRHDTHPEHSHESQRPFFGEPHDDTSGGAETFTSSRYEWKAETLPPFLVPRRVSSTMTARRQSSGDGSVTGLGGGGGGHDACGTFYVVVPRDADGFESVLGDGVRGSTRALMRVDREGIPVRLRSWLEGTEMEVVARNVEMMAGGRRTKCNVVAVSGQWDEFPSRMGGNGNGRVNHTELVASPTYAGVEESGSTSAPRKRKSHDSLRGGWKDDLVVGIGSGAAKFLGGASKVVVSEEPSEEDEVNGVGLGVEFDVALNVANNAATVKEDDGKKENSRESNNDGGRCSGDWVSITEEQVRIAETIAGVELMSNKQLEQIEGDVLSIMATATEVVTVEDGTEASSLWMTEGQAESATVDMENGSSSSVTAMDAVEYVGRDGQHRSRHSSYASLLDAETPVGGRSRADTPVGGVGIGVGIGIGSGSGRRMKGKGSRDWERDASKRVGVVVPGKDQLTGWLL